MSKRIKEQLQAQKQKNHEEFRRQLVDDVEGQLSQWETKISKELARNLEEIKETEQSIQKTKVNIMKTNGNLSTIRHQTLDEIRRFKQGIGWWFYLWSFLFGLLGSLAGIALWEAYGPVIIELLGS